MERLSRLCVGSACLWFALAGLVPAAAQELRKEGRDYVTEINKTFTVKSGGTLRISDVRGDVFVRTWDKHEVAVRERKKMDVYTEEEARTILEKSRASYRQTSTGIEIGGESYSRDWIQSEFEVTVPKTFNVDIATRGGDLEVSGLVGSAVLNTSGGNIDLTGINGPVNARTSGGDVRVSRISQRAEVRTSGGDMVLEEIGGALTAKTSGGDILLRGATDRVELLTSGGDIEIRQAGGEVQARTSGGDIEIVDTRGPVNVHTSGGDIEFRNVGGSLEATTSGGDIEGRGVDGRAKVATSGGSIEVHGVNGGVQARTSGGDVTVEITLSDFSRDHAVDLRSSGGELKLILPERLPATIRAEIEITDRWDDYHIYSDFPLTSKEEGEAGERRRRRHRKFIRSEGDINGGGDLIELFTVNGNIYIKKQSR